MIFGAHPLSFFTRLVHVASMAYLLGGSLLLWALFAGEHLNSAGERSRFMADLACKYELLFWLATGLIVLTGVGNLGVFGNGLPGPGAIWGAKLVIKLCAILIFVALSLLRTFLVAGYPLTTPESNIFTPGRPFQAYYALTAVYLVGILFLALSLAHG